MDAPETTKAAPVRPIRISNSRMVFSFGIDHHPGSRSKAAILLDSLLSGSPSEVEGLLEGHTSIEIDTCAYHFWAVICQLQSKGWVLDTDVIYRYPDDCELPACCQEAIANRAAAARFSDERVED